MNILWLLTRFARSLTDAEKAALAWLAAYTFPTEADYLRHERQLSDHAIKIRLGQYRVFWIALLLSADNRSIFVPSELDALWHQALTQPQEYAEFCYRMFGYFLKHEPERETSEGTVHRIDRMVSTTMAFHVRETVN